MKISIKYALSIVPPETHRRILKLSALFVVEATPAILYILSITDAWAGTRIPRFSLTWPLHLPLREAEPNGKTIQRKKTPKNHKIITVFRCLLKKEYLRYDIAALRRLFARNLGHVPLKYFSKQQRIEIGNGGNSDKNPDNQALQKQFEVKIPDQQGNQV